MIDFPASPTTGQLFTSGALSYRYDGHAWLGTPPAGVMTIPDAPNDGVIYGRQSQAWVPVSASGGGGVWIGDTAPTDTTKYPFWWSSTSLQLSIWYNDGNSSQWVDTNGAPSSPPGAWLLQDGTVAAPGLAWANEPGLGLYRKSTSVIGVAAQGSEAVELDASGAGTYITAYTKSNAGAQLRLFNNAPGAASFNYLNLYLNPDGKAGLVTNGVGGAARGTFGLDAAQILFNDGTVAAPGISFASEPGLGWYRQGAGVIAATALGGVTTYIAASSTVTTKAIYPISAGTTLLLLANQPLNTPNVNYLRLECNPSGYGLQEQLQGTATGKQMTVSFPGGTVFPYGVAVNGGLTVLSTFQLAGGMEIGPQTGTAGPANIDFHTGPTGTDFQMRLLVSSVSPDIMQLESSTLAPKLVFNGATAGWYGGNVTDGATNAVAWAYLPAGAHAGHVGVRVDATQFGALAWSTDLSDMRFKKDVVPLSYGLDTVMQIGPIEFEFDHALDDYMPQGMQYGFSAQDMQAAVPRAVSEIGGKLRIESRFLLPVLWKAIQDLNAKIEALQ